MITRILIASLCGASFCAADANTSFSDIKRHVQMGPESLAFGGGNLSLNVFDGESTLGVCAFDPSVTIVPANTVFCAPGTQGLVTAGDLDGDGVQDAGLFQAITAVSAASQIQPFETDRVKILAAPPSGIADILRSSDGDVSQVFEVEDTSVIIWWDVLSFPIQQYNITKFDGLRPYGTGGGELSRQYSDLPWGNYLFSYPFLDDPQNPFDDLFQLNFGVNHFVSPDVFPGRSVVPTGWRLDGPDDMWVTYDSPRGTLDLGFTGAPVDITGALEVDPKNFFQLVWTGINSNNTVGLDQLFFSIVGDYPAATLDPLTDACVLDGGEPNFGIVFPPYSPCTPESDRDEILLGTFDGRVDMPPFFFSPGDFVFAHLRFVRGIPAGNQTFDRSERSIFVPLSMVENWAGFATFTAPFSVGGFPFGTPASDRIRFADFDLDGADNLTEFALATDLADDTDVPPIVAAMGVPMASTAGSCTASFIKRAYLSSEIKFTFETSMDGVSWSKISESDPDWMITTVITDLTGTPLDLDVLDSDGDGSVTDLFVNPAGNFEIGGVEYLGDFTDTVTVVNTVDLPGTDCFIRLIVTD